MGREGFNLVTPHREECWYVDRPREAFVLHSRFDSRAKNGRRRGSWTWHIFRCNDPDCPGEAGVRWDVLARAIGEGIED